MTVGPEGARLAREEDLRPIGELAAALLEGLGAARGGPLLARSLGWLLEPTSLRRCLGDLDRFGVVVGTYDGAAVGIGLVEHPSPADLDDGPGDRVAVLRVLYVEPGMRDVGVGEAILDEVLRLARDRGATALDVLTLPGDGATKSFLEARGFRARLLVMNRPFGPELGS